MARKRSITSCISSSEIKRLKMDRAEEDEDNIEALQSSRSYRPNELGTLGEDDDDKVSLRNPLFLSVVLTAS